MQAESGISCRLYAVSADRAWGGGYSVEHMVPIRERKNA